MNTIFYGKFDFFGFFFVLKSVLKILVLKILVLKILVLKNLVLKILVLTNFSVKNISVKNALPNVIINLESGKPLVSEQQVRHTLAEVKTDAMIARAITDKQIEAYENDDMDQSSISMVKLWTSEKLIENITKCQQLMGHRGLIMGKEQENRVGYGFAAARVQTIYAGTSEVMKEIISRTI